jgi:hypothetical protein
MILVNALLLSSIDSVANRRQLSAGVFDFLRTRVPTMIPVTTAPLKRSILCDDGAAVLTRDASAYWKDVQLTYLQKHQGNVIIDTAFMSTGVRHGAGADTDVNLWYNLNNGEFAYTGITVAASETQIWHLHSSTGWTHSEWVTLPFDPAAAFHNYSLQLFDTNVLFYIDGVLVSSLSDLAPFEYAGEIRLMTHCGTSYCKKEGSNGVEDCRSCGAGTSRFRTLRVTRVGTAGTAGTSGVQVPLCVNGSGAWAPAASMAGDSTIIASGGAGLGAGAIAAMALVGLVVIVAAYRIHKKRKAGDVSPAKQQDCVVVQTATSPAAELGSSALATVDAVA